MNDTKTFLEDLWPSKPAAAAVQLWEKGSKKNYTFLDLGGAALWAATAAKTTDIYIAAGLAARMDKPSRVRATASSVIGIPGVWADIDVNGGPEGKTGAAETMEDALILARQVLEPTTIVMSGYGIQAWWLFEEPWLFALESERDQAARLSRAFQTMLKGAAKEMNPEWKVDSTHDLARLMRLPGTMNHKGQPPMVVELLQSDGPRYSVETLSGVCEEALSKMEATALNGAHSSVSLDDLGAPPFERIDDLMDMDVEFAATWRHERVGKRRQWGASEFDLSIANSMVNAGFDDQDIANSISYHRSRYGDDKGKAKRKDYLALTIGKARSAARIEEVKTAREVEVEAAIEMMGQMAEAETPAAASVTVSYFHKIVGGPEIKELVQDGTDPDIARYKLVFADGRELAIGTARDLINQDRFIERYMTLTQHLPKAVARKDWHNVVRSLLTAVQVIEDEGASRNAMTLSWIEDYIEHRMSRDKDKACQVHDPYSDDGYIFIPMSAFTAWIRKAKGERIGETDVRQLLVRLGFERKTVAYNSAEDGKRSSRSYYRGLQSIVNRDSEPAGSAV